MPVLLTVLGRHAQGLKSGGLIHQRATRPNQKTDQNSVQERSFANVAAVTPEDPLLTAPNTQYINRFNLKQHKM